MSDVQQIIDWIANAGVNLFNVLKQLGVYFYAWLAVIFVFPNLKRLIRALKGSR